MINTRGLAVTKYFLVTEKELKAIIAVSDSMLAMTGGDNDEFDKEARKGAKAISSILKRDEKKKNK
jgi:hypothetical protein